MAICTLLRLAQNHRVHRRSVSTGYLPAQCGHLGIGLSEKAKNVTGCESIVGHHNIKKTNELLSSKRFLPFLQIQFDFPQTSNGRCLWYVHVNVMQTPCLSSNPRTSVAQLRSPVTAELNSLTKPGNISFFLPTSWPLVFPSH